MEEITLEWNRWEKFTLSIQSKLKHNHMIAVMEMIISATLMITEYFVHALNKFQFCFKVGQVR